MEKNSITEVFGKMEQADFDETDLVKSQIIPKIEEISDICKKHNIPFIAAVCPSMHGTKIEIMNAAVLAGKRTPKVLKRAIGVIQAGPNLPDILDIALDVNYEMQMADTYKTL